MSGLVVIGSQWGDEGKGKVVDWLSLRADVVVRFQGGHNAGHTLVLDGKVYKLHLLPSGVVRPNKLSIIGNGVVINPWHLRDEILHLRSQGLDINPHNLKIADNACLILPLHWELDSLREGLQGSIGTTQRGIGPAYEDKVGRRSIRVADLFDRDGLIDKINNIAAYHDILRSSIGLKPVNRKLMLQELLEIAPFVKPYTCVLWKVLEEQHYQNKRVLFEGAQGVMLDLDHGTYPFVTSSNSVPYHAITGSGFGKNHINFVLGITKAYTTRVGCGPFPTEQDNEIGNQLRVHGKETGSTTGRYRRCGWFDAVQVRQAVKVAGINGLALTKLDVLDDFVEIKICIAYKLKDKVIDYFPASLVEQNSLEPIYETWSGWRSVTRHSRSWTDLPLEANRYLRRIEELTGSNIALLSTSPDRDDTICTQDIF